MKSSENGKKKRKRSAGHKHQDLISKLPDDILVAIISHLNVRELTTTSILSSRWRYLPTYIPSLTPSFNHKFKTGNFWVIEEVLINRVLDDSRGRVKEYRVHMDCLEGGNINSWISYGYDTDVEFICIHLDYVEHYRHAKGHYPIPENLNFMGETLICLTELSLLGVNVNDGDIQLLLHKFPLLESLSIKGSSSLRHVSIVGHSSSKLKHLEISEVRYSGMIEIDIEDLVNLVSLWFFKLVFSLNIKNVPKLVEFSMCDDYKCSGARILSGMPSSIHHQLQTLKIFTDSYCSKEYERGMPLQLNGLKNLELQHRVADLDDEALCFNPFHIIRACPSLEKLEIKFSCDVPSLIKVNEDYYEEYAVLDSSAKKVCPHLKKMKIFGFIGSLSEMNFIFSILKNVNPLEELAVETYDEDQKIRNLARNLAKRIFRLKASKVVVV